MPASLLSGPCFGTIIPFRLGRRPCMRAKHSRHAPSQGVSGGSRQGDSLQAWRGAGRAPRAGAAAPTLSPAACLTSHDPLAEPVAQHMEACRRNLLALVGRRHPLLRAAADQIFSAGGKRLRPLIVLLVSSAALRTVGLA